jgi:sugar lactone lactonase YvrE
MNANQLDYHAKVANQRNMKRKRTKLMGNLMNELTFLKLWLLLVFIVIFLIPRSTAEKTINFVNDLEIALELEKNVFYSEDEIKAVLKIKNLGDQKKEFWISSEIYSPKGIYTPLQPIEDFFSVDGNSEKKFEMKWYPGLLKTNETYFISVKILEFGKEIVHINDSFFFAEKEIELFSCLDENCNKQATIFYEGERACFKYESKIKEINFELLYPSGERKNINLPSCLNNLKRGNYQLIASVKVNNQEKKYYLNFSVIETFPKKLPKAFDIRIYLSIFFVTLFILLFYKIKARKGQTSFFIKVIFVVISAALLVFVFMHFSKYKYEIEKEKHLSEFKTDVTNLAQKLFNNPNCLSTGEKSIIDKNKLDLFQKKYVEIEPECAKEINFDYNVKLVQYSKKIAFLPEIKKSIKGTLAWAPNSGPGNSVSLISSGGFEVRRHWTVPSGITGDPSRTAVDSKGNAWVGNRGTNTLVKIAFSEDECIDKNGNGIIETSYDKNGDGDVTQDEMMPFDEDECIVKNVVLGSTSGTKIRAVCIDEKDNVYAGHWNDKKLFYVSSDGKILKEWNLPINPYGCVVDKNGIVWVTNYMGYVVKLNPNTNKIVTKNFGQSYSIWSCADGSCIVISGSKITKINATTLEVIWSKNVPYSYVSGVFVDTEGNVYGAWTGGNSIIKYDKDGIIIGSEPACGNPKGISMDFEGNLWVLCYDSGVAIFDKELNVINKFHKGGNHYAYTDFTGYLTGAKLVQKKVNPIREVEIEEKEWNFGIKSFSPEKAKEFEVTISVPISIRYNETFTIEGIAYIYAVKGELEGLYGIIDELCEKAKENPSIDIKFSKEFHFSHPVKLDGNKLCMLDHCKNVTCNVLIKMKEFEEGEHVVNFVYDPTLGIINIY